MLNKWNIWKKTPDSNLEEETSPENAEELDINNSELPPENENLEAKEDLEVVTTEDVTEQSEKLENAEEESNQVLEAELTKEASAEENSATNTQENTQSSVADLESVEEINIADSHTQLESEEVEENQEFEIEEVEYSEDLDALGLNEKGITEAKKGVWSNAVSYYQRSINVNPKLSFVYYNLGISYHQQEKWQEAIEAYTQAVQLEQNAQYYNNRGNTLFCAGKESLALEDYNKAIQVHDSYFEAYQNRAQLHYHQSNWSEAQKDLEKALKILPQNPSCFYNLACTYAQMEKEESAVEYLRKALAAGYPAIENFTSDPDLSFLQGKEKLEQLIATWSS